MQSLKKQLNKSIKNYGSKILTRKRNKINTSEQEQAKMWKKHLHLNKKSRFTFNSRKNLLFFLKSNFYKSKFANMYMSYEKLAIIFDINTLQFF